MKSIISEEKYNEYPHKKRAFQILTKRGTTNKIDQNLYIFHSERYSRHKKTFRSNEMHTRVQCSSRGTLNVDIFFFSLFACYLHSSKDYVERTRKYMKTHSEQKDCNIVEYLTDTNYKLQIVEMKVN